MVTTAAGAVDLDHAMSPAEGAEVFRRVLASSFSRVVVSTRDLQARIDEHAAPNMARRLDQLAQVPSATVRQSRPAQAGDFVAPGSERERILAEMWGEVLGIDAVGLHDNFFELGGTSLHALQVAARAREVGLQLTPETLFEYQTIAELAAHQSPAGDEHTKRTPS